MGGFLCEIWQGHKDLNPEPTVLETEVQPNYFACSAGKVENAPSKILRFYYDCDLEPNKTSKSALCTPQKTWIFRGKQIQLKYANADPLGLGIPK